MTTFLRTKAHNFVVEATTDIPVPVQGGRGKGYSKDLRRCRVESIVAETPGSLSSIYAVTFRIVPPSRGARRVFIYRFAAEDVEAFGDDWEANKKAQTIATVKKHDEATTIEKARHEETMKRIDAEYYQTLGVIGA